MGIADVVTLLGGIALFLFGMSLMGEGLKKVAGSRLELVLYKLSSTPLKGVLLGTGGLVRAYTQAVKEGLAHCETGILRKGCELEVTTDYNDVGKLQYYFGQQGIVPVDSIYAENVKFILLIPMENEEKVRKNLTETTCGKVKIEKLKETYFVDKE